MIAKEPGHVSQRIFLHYYIGINEENYAAMHFSNAPIPGGSRSALRPEFENRYIVSPRQLRALIGRAIIDNENFIIMELGSDQGFQTPCQMPAAVMDWNYDGNCRGIPQT